MNILISKCLIGCNCRYKGDNCKNDKLLEILKNCTIIPVCPEVLGGLPTPRLPGEITGNKVINSEGVDITINYRRGAEIALEIAKKEKVVFCIMKSKSPSCGCGEIYDGSFSGKLKKGNGITSELLINNGYTVWTENDIDKIVELLSSIKLDNYEN